MERIIEIEEGRSYRFKASAFSPIVYNMLFPGRDFMRDINKLLEMSGSKEGSTMRMEDYETFVRVAYTFAYQGLSDTPKDTPEKRKFRETYPDAWDWIDSFGMFSMYEVMPQIVELWVDNERTVSERKNPVPAPQEK